MLRKNAALLKKQVLGVYIYTEIYTKPVVTKELTRSDKATNVEPE